MGGVGAEGGMGMSQPKQLNDEARIWLLSRNLIAKALTEMTADTEDECKQNAAVIIARLAANKPPLLICTMDQIKD